VSGLRRIRKQSGFEQWAFDPGDQMACEWFSRQTRKHGGTKRRVRHGRSDQWRDVAHGARSTSESTNKHWKPGLPSSPPATSAMSSREAPPVRANRRGMLPEPLDQIPPEQQIASVTADGAFDTRKCPRPSRRAGPPPSYRLVKTQSRKSPARRGRSHETKLCAHQNASVGPSGDDGAAATAEAASKPGCIV